MSTQLIPLSKIDPDAQSSGGKATGLAKLIRAGMPVPDGFVIPINAYENFISLNNLEEKIRLLLEKADFETDGSIEQCSEKIKALMTEAIMDYELSESLIDSLGEKKTDCCWAVRSSAVAEDLPDASFAGQQDSYLNVKTAEVPEHVRKCWMSYWNERAITYRHNSGIPQFLGGIAVIIQEMVDARASGILFTSDPIKKNTEVSVIESSWGLGESIVSGLVTPDRFECEKKSARVIKKEIGLKTRAIFMSPEGKVTIDIKPEKQKIPSISELEIIELISIGRKIEEYFENPQDIEWAIQEGRIFILQSRPITTIKKGNETLWTRAYGDEYWADVTSPLFFSILGHYLSEYVNREGSKIMGYKNLTKKNLLKVHKGHVYFNSEVLEEVFTYNPRFSRTRELLNYFPQKDQQRIANAKTRIVSRILAELRIALFDPDGMIIRTNKAYEEWAVWFLEKMKKFDAIDLTRVGDDELYLEFVKMEKALLKHYRLIRYGLVTHSIGMNLIIKRWLSDWLNDKSGTLYSKLISGLPGNKTIETNIAIVRLANKARSDPKIFPILTTMESGAFLEKLNNDGNLSDFRIDLDRFLHEYGHRSHTREIYFPRWIDDPTLIIDLLKTLTTSSPSDLDKLEKEKIEERLATETIVLDSISNQKFGLAKKIVFKTIMKYAQTYLIFRENQRFLLDHQILRQRRLFMEYGRRFSERGWISEQKDIFFLSKEEIFEIARTRNPMEKEIVRSRKDEFVKYMNILPPKFLRGDIEFDDSILALRNAIRITGTPSSPGIVTGKARVIDSIKHLSEVNEDEMLITSNTDPGWTAVFAKISGLVTETGGILSHGAIVSREYGIPAVTAVGNATKILKTGQMITVDGNDGIIYIKGAESGSDIIHNFGEQKDWNESFYFNFYDRKEDICGFMRIGLRPNTKHKAIFCFLLMPDGSVIGKRSKIEFLDDSLEGEGLRYEIILPEKEWKMSYSGKMEGKQPESVDFGLIFEACNEIFDYRNCVTQEKQELSKKIVSEHLEQFGRVKGRLKVGSKEYLIDGLGERDHSWGVRDWHAPKMWIWLTCQFSEKAALNVTKLFVEKGVVDAGFIHLNGENLPIIRADIDTRYGEDGAPVSLLVQLHDIKGKSHFVKADIMRGTTLPFESEDKKSHSIMHETLARYKFSDMIGFGIAEYLIKQR